MAIEFKPVTLDSGEIDSEAMLVFRNGRLSAVLTRLGAIHGEMRGRWFVEATFVEYPKPSNDTFETPSDAESWIARNG